MKDYTTCKDEETDDEETDDEETDNKNNAQGKCCSTKKLIHQSDHSFSGNLSKF